MEIVILLALVGYAAWWIGRPFTHHLRHWKQLVRMRNESAGRAKMEEDQRRVQAYARAAKLRLQNQEMQAALLELESARDFQRAAWFAGQAQDIPLLFRQRQFRRFRSNILQHLQSCLQAGVEREELRQSLVLLVTHLGFAPFEADYLWREAEAQVQPASPPFATEMASLEREHAERRAVLSSLTGIDADLREQLVEAEQERFRQAMLSLNDQLTPQSAET